MADILKYIGVEMQDISLVLVFATAIGFLFLILACRIVGRIVPFRQHKKLVWVLDLLLLPVLLFSIQFIVNRVIEPQLRAYIQDLDLFIETLLWLTGAWLLVRGLELFLWTTGFKKATGSECPRLLRGLVAAAIYFLAFYGILTFVFDRAVTGLLVSTGIVAGVLGLAMQNVLSDLFAGLAITIEEPFRLGDWIELKDGTLGQVTDINWRTTRLVSFNNSVYVVPNGIAASSVIHNYNLPERPYARWYTVSVDSEIAPELVRQLLLEACLSCRAVLQNPLPIVRLSEISTQPFKYAVYVHFADYPSHFTAAGELFSTIRAYLTRSGISPSAVRYEIATREARITEIREPSVEEYLRGIPLLTPLSDEEIQKLAGTCQIKRFNAGEMLIQEGNVDNSLFVISSGVVSVLKADGSGHPVEVTRLSHSECFGEMALLTGEPRYATAQAITPVQVIQVPKEGLAPLLERRSELSAELAEIMAQRRARTDGVMHSVSTPPPSGSMTAYAKEILGKIRSFFSLD